MKTPIAPTLKPCPATLDAGLLQQMRKEGYLAFRDVLSSDEVAAARVALTEVVQRLMAMPDKIVQTGANGAANQSGARVHKPDSRFFVLLEQGPDIRALSPEQIEIHTRKLMNFCDEHPVFAHIAQTQAHIQGVLASLLGPQSIRFQDMALIKPPFIGSEKPWHQDDAYFTVTPLDAVIGVWIALDDATAANGCMHVIPGDHLRGPRKHFHGRDCEIAPDRLDLSRQVAVELPAGGAMFFYGLLPHETPPNRSPHRRRALQHHYRAASSVVMGRDEFERVFVEADGTPASCHAAR